MNLYTVTVYYTIGTSSTTETMSIRRRANTAAQAISAVSAAFGGLSNYYDANNTPWIRVSRVEAAIVT